jgi:hypothetical protein
LQQLDDGKLALETPPDPRTGVTRLALDPLEWIHRITSHIPDPGRHCQRFYGPIRTGAESESPARKPATPMPAPRRARIRIIRTSPGKPVARGRVLSGKSSRRTLCFAPAVPACASVPLSRNRALSIASCAIGKASAATRRILSSRELRRAPMAALCSNARPSHPEYRPGSRPVYAQIEEQRSGKRLSERLAGRAYSGLREDRSGSNNYAWSKK